MYEFQILNYFEVIPNFLYPLLKSLITVIALWFIIGLSYSVTLKQIVTDGLSVFM